MVFFDILRWISWMRYVYLMRLDALQDFILARILPPNRSFKHSWALQEWSQKKRFICQLYNWDFQWSSETIVPFWSGPLWHNTKEAFHVTWSHYFDTTTCPKNQRILKIQQWIKYRRNLHFQEDTHDRGALYHKLINLLGPRVVKCEAEF